MQHKIYISGPITGQDDKNRKAFKDAELRLKELGYHVINPVEWVEHFERMHAVRYSEIEKMGIDLHALSQCNFVAVLPGWEESKGACMEVLFALEYNIPVYHAETMQRVKLPACLRLCFVGLGFPPAKRGCNAPKAGGFPKPQFPADRNQKESVNA